jgi:hypothetical protein
MLNNQKIRVQKPIYAALRAALLGLLELPAPDGTRYAFLPADVGQVVDGCCMIWLAAALTLDIHSSFVSILIHGSPSSIKLPIITALLMRARKKKEHIVNDQ